MTATKVIAQSSMLFLLLLGSSEAASGTAVFSGKVSGVDGRAVEGARIFVYDSPEVRRQADFISAPTDRDGQFRMVLPPGKFWMIARLKKGDEYGPLMPGDKHSGDPVEIELSSQGTVTMDFIAADLLEARQKRTKEREGLVKLSGRLVDEKGAPIKGAYAFANRSETVNGIPDYLSAWTDDEGRYTLYLPPGTYYLGGALRFPPGQSYFLQGAVTVDRDSVDRMIVKKSKISIN